MTPSFSTNRGFALRYGIVAGSCAVLHNAIVVSAALAGIGVLGAAAISFCLMVVIGYLLLCAAAFRTTPTWASFARYFTAMAANFPLTTGLLWLFAVPFHLPIVVVAPAVTMLMIVVNSLGARWAIGRGSRSCKF